MSAKAVSYATAAMNGALAVADCPGHTDECACWHSTRDQLVKCDCWVSDHAAALRALAALVERIEAVQRRIDEWRETAITGTMQMREPLILLELIAAGYTSPEDGPQ